MNVIISHASALHILDMCARKEPPEAFSEEPMEHALCDAREWACTARALKQFKFADICRPGMPMDILIPTYAHLHTPKGFTFHGVGGHLPKGSFLDIGNGMLVCAPELVYIQLCQGATLRECIDIGCFLCGTYSLEPTVRSGVVERKALTTRDDLDTFLKQAKRLRGARNAAAALPWVLNGSASPKETELALLLYLPFAMDGFGFEKPVLNHVVDLDSAERKLVGTENVRIDVYWPKQRIGFEYTSYAEHSEEKKIGEDMRRALVLRKKGIHIEFVTQEQLSSLDQMSILADILVEHGVPPANLDKLARGSKKR